MRARRMLGRPAGLAICAALFAAGHAAAGPIATEDARWREEAARVTITRDDWGIAHVHGRTDADAVFGMIYAQAQDDYSRIESNYLTALGRRGLAEGEGAIWSDLRARLYENDDDLKARYAASPSWLRALMSSWADGLNFYLATRPAARSGIISHYEPWMALSFSEGSIGGDIERISLPDLASFYGHARVTQADPPLGEIIEEPGGSNGIAIAPANTRDHHALLLINPHTSFYFRSEMQVSSDEGLNAYGASTWGQFFIYQGFNAHLGWMHTSSGVDAVDEYAETIVHKDGRLYYRFGKDLRPLESEIITVPYSAEGGNIKTRAFTVYRTHHGPIVREADGKWVSIAMMYRPVEALSQSFLRTKTDDYASYLKVAQLRANSSNNTILADDKGEIAYLHPQFIPVRDDRFDFTQVLDGADPATDWKGLHDLDQAPHLLNPPVGWLFNTNDWPYSAAGQDSPRRTDYPRYMDTAGENPRGLHALRLLEGRRDFTLEGLRDAAYDSWLPAFARLIPGLVAAWDQADPRDPLKARLAGQVALLRSWDDRWGADSQATSLAVFWGEALYRARGLDPGEDETAYEAIAARATARQQLDALAVASDRLTADFGAWRVPWGRINRFQRLDDKIVQIFADEDPSLPVPFTSAVWGSLAAFGAHRYPDTRRYYGYKGNSFVAVVEFGPRVRALAVTAGGESGDPKSPHFNDQAARYASGDLRPVYFYPDELAAHIERRYRPGEP